MVLNNLLTNKRLSDFVDSYKTWTEEVAEVHSSPASSNEPPYQYSHFELSPNAITTNSIGRFGKSIFESVGWDKLDGTNGIESWKMNLGKKMLSYKTAENTRFTNEINNSNKTNLKCIKSNLEIKRSILFKLASSSEEFNVSGKIKETFSFKFSKFGAFSLVTLSKFV